MIKTNYNYFKEEFSIFKRKTIKLSQVFQSFVTSTLITFLCLHWYFPLIRVDYNSLCFEFVDLAWNQSGLYPRNNDSSSLRLLYHSRIFNFLEICLEIIACPPQSRPSKRLTRSTRRSRVYILENRKVVRSFSVIPIAGTSNGIVMKHS